MRLRATRRPGVSAGVSQPVPSLDLNFVQNTEAGRSSSWWNLFKGGTTQLDEFFDPVTGEVSYGPHNLTAASEDLTNAAWEKSPHWSAVTASVISYSSPASYPVLTIQTPLTSTAAFVKIRVKKLSGSDWLWCYFNGLSASSAWFNLVTGQVGFQESAITATIQAVGDDYFDITLSKTSYTTVIIFNIIPVVSDGSTAVVTGSGSLTISRGQICLGSVQPYLSTTTTPIYSTRPRITYSSSLGTRIGPTGLVEWGPHNISRFSERLVDGNGWNQDGAELLLGYPAPAGTGTVESSRIRKTITSTNYVRFQNLPSFDVKANQTVSCAAWLWIESGTAEVFPTYLVTGGWNDLSRLVLTSTPTLFTWQYTPNLNTIEGSAFTLKCNFIGGAVIGITGVRCNLGPLQSYWPTFGAPYYGPRFTYDPVTLAPLGLLVEEQRTNLLLNSATNAGSWVTQSGGTITQNAVVAPDGTLTATLFNQNNTTGARFASSNSSGPSLTAGSTYSHSIYLKAATAADVGKRTTLYQYTTTLSGSVPVTLTADWKRYSGVFVPPNSGVCIVQVGTEIGVNDVCSMHVWGAQLEAGANATSYKPTTTATVVRAEDFVAMAQVDISPWFNPAEGTFFIEMSSKPYGINPIVLLLGSSEFATSRDSGSWGTWNGSTEVNTPNAVNGDTPVKFASLYTPSSRTVCLNGGSTGSGAGGFTTLGILQILPTFARVQVGTMQRIRYYPRALPVATLQRLTFTNPIFLIQENGSYITLETGGFITL